MQDEARKLKETDFEVIKEHQKKYEEMLTLQKSERINKIVEFRK